VPGVVLVPSIPCFTVSTLVPEWSASVVSSVAAIVTAHVCPAIPRLAFTTKVYAPDPPPGAPLALSPAPPAPPGPTPSHLLSALFQSEGSVMLPSDVTANILEYANQLLHSCERRCSQIPVLNRHSLLALPL